MSVRARPSFWHALALASRKTPSSPITSMGLALDRKTPEKPSPSLTRAPFRNLARRGLYASDRSANAPNPSPTIPVRDGHAPVAAEGLGRDPHPGRLLATLVLGE